jgi:hypothetical protein
MMIVGSSKYFHVGFEHVQYYGKARQLGTAETDWQVPGLEEVHNGLQRVYTHYSEGYKISVQETSYWTLRREEAGYSVSEPYNGEGSYR